MSGYEADTSLDVRQRRAFESMRYAIKIVAIIVFSLTCCTAQAQEHKQDTSKQSASKDRVPRFADYPAVKISKERVKRPIIPRGWHEDPRLRLLDATRDVRANFAGRYFMAITPCGSACVGGAIIEARTGKMIPLGIVSSWKEVHDKFEGIEFRHNSRMFVMSGQRDEKPGDMGQHFYVLENGKVRLLKTIKTDGNFMTPVK
jgi:hypothetical protein